MGAGEEAAPGSAAVAHVVHDARDFAAEVLMGERRGLEVRPEDVGRGGEERVRLEEEADGAGVAVAVGVKRREGEEGGGGSKVEG